MNRNRKYFIPILIALFCLLYQAMPLHKIFSDSNFISISLVEEKDASEENDLVTKKSKQEIDDFLGIKTYSILKGNFKISTIYYFHHLPKSYEVKSVFAPPPEIV